jgi:rhamnogalacturonan endolyase
MCAQHRIMASFMDYFRIVLSLVLAAGTARGADLFRDDFSRFSPGWLTHPVGTLNGAIQEYHYIASRSAPLGGWENAICYQDAWVASDEAGKPYLEQQLTSGANQFTEPIFLTGDPEWSDYTVEARVKPLLLNGAAGIVFRYHTNRHYYRFALEDGSRARLSLHLPIEDTFRVPKWRELASAGFHYDATRYYALRVENDGPRMRGYIDGKLVLEATDAEILKGKAGITAGAPARFQDFAVTASSAQVQAIAGRIRSRESALAQLRADNPRPKLWKKFDTPRFGAGRNVRFGDLDGDGVPDMLIAQNIPRVRGDGFDQISCLTAVNFDGKVLWQSGRPDPRNGLLTNDTPFQIHDIDGDGRNEVVVVRDFQLQVLDGRTGQVRRWVWMPKTPPDDRERPYEMESGDAIAFVNFSGDRNRHEILVKDRYSHFWVYSNTLDLLWSGEGQTGHFPYPLEIGGAGRDTLAIGYAVWDHTGHRLWSHDRDLRDHADGIAMGNFSGDPQAAPRVYASGSDEGFLMFDQAGNILKHVRIGHSQSPAIGKFRTDVAGLQYATVNFWRNPGIITLFDWDGNILAQDEPIHSGSVMLPVNWRGDGREFILLSGNAREGGLIDGQLRRVVMFPDDGHPDLTANVLNVTGDARDEIVLWDQERVWIYTQDRPFTGKRIYAPIRNPDYNESNYRSNVSLPHWADLR